MLKTPESIRSVATVTELRTQTTEIVETAKASGEAVLIVKNNEPYAVLVSFDRYMELVGGRE